MVIIPKIDLLAGRLQSGKTNWSMVKSEKSANV